MTIIWLLYTHLNVWQRQLYLERHMAGSLGGVWSQVFCKQTYCPVKVNANNYNDDDENNNNTDRLQRK